MIKTRFNSMSKMLPILNSYIKLWERKRKKVARIMKFKNGLYKKEDITYFMELRNFVDHSLVYDIGIFKYKPPLVLKTLWIANIYKIKDFISDIIQVEKVYSKEKTVTAEHISHMLDMKWIANYVLKKKFPDIPILERKKIMAGDYKNKDHFQITKKGTSVF